MTADRITARLADYQNAGDAQALVSLLDAYARDPAGGGVPLSEFAKSHLHQRCLHAPKLSAYWHLTAPKPSV